MVDGGHLQRSSGDTQSCILNRLETRERSWLDVWGEQWRVSSGDFFFLVAFVVVTFEVTTVVVILIAVFIIFVSVVPC